MRKFQIELFKFDKFVSYIKRGSIGQFPDYVDNKLVRIEPQGRSEAILDMYTIPGR